MKLFCLFGWHDWVAKYSYTPDQAVNGVVIYELPLDIKELLDAMEIKFYVPPGGLVHKKMASEIKPKYICKCCGKIQKS